MKVVTRIVISLALVLMFATLSAVADEPKPNIVYIVADDLGWKDVGFHGSDIKTPNLDRLAADGARLERFYAQNMCTQSRAALLTGRYPFRYGLQTIVIPSAGTYGLPTDEWLLPQALKAAGYTTAIVGKWHVGHADQKFWPRQRGFDYQYGPLLGEIDYFTRLAHGTIDWFRDNERVIENGYVTTLLGDDAVRVIEQHDADTPLFLYLAFTAPHAPYQAPQEYLDKYTGIEDPSRRAYAAMITCMDDQVGRVVKALEKQRMRKNTLIMFQSDNGGPRSAKFTGEVDMSQATIPADNGPYRDGKAMMYEGGHRVVSLANWPGKIKAGTVVDQPIHIVDVFPTLTGLAGVSTNESKPLDGLNVWPVIAQGAASPRTEVVYNLEPFRAAISQGDWKLVWGIVVPSKVELFNLKDDPSEQMNLADRNPEKVTELQARVQALAAEGVAPLLMSELMGAATSVLMTSVNIPVNAQEIESIP